jgi:DNA-binding NarL/FixJ family response regulator
MTKIRIFIADDQLILIEALKALLMATGRYEIVGTATDGRDAIAQIPQLKPQVAILDIAIPGLSGIEIAKQMLKYYPEVRVILLSHYDDSSFVKDALKVGVHGYVLKTGSFNSLIEAIEAVQKGGAYLSPRITGQLVGALHSGKNILHTGETALDRLTPREREILELIVDGKSQSQVAGELFITVATVKSHRLSMMKKLGVHKSVDLVKYAIKNGIIKL